MNVCAKASGMRLTALAITVRSAASAVSTPHSVSQLRDGGRWV